MPGVNGILPSNGLGGDIFNTLKSGKLTANSATQIVTKLAGQNTPLGQIAPQLGQVSSIVNNLAAGKGIDPKTAGNLLQGVAGKAIPAELGQIASGISNLGNIKDPAKLAQNILGNKGVQNLLGKAGLPAQATQALSQVIGLASGDPKKIAQALATSAGQQALKQALGQLPIGDLSKLGQALGIKPRRGHTRANRRHSQRSNKRSQSGSTKHQYNTERQSAATTATAAVKQPTMLRPLRSL